MTGADAMVKCLEEEGVKMIFGYPGVAICPFLDSLYHSEIETILIRTEQNAAHAASGMARVTNIPGVCFVTSGPGATNLITGIATAFADSIPLICITGQVDSELLGSDVFQEADITGAVESFVKYSYLVKNTEDIPRIFKEAFYIANSGRKGPVLIDIPIDIQKKNLQKFSYPASANLRTYKPTVKGHSVQIKKLAKELAKAKRPIICAGGGVLLSDAQNEIRSLSESLNLPVVSTMMGIGVMPSDHPMYFGMVGNNGFAYANRAMNESDLIIMIGARVADRAVSQPDLITKDKILVHIDVDPAEIGKNADFSIPIVGDAKHILQEFMKEELISNTDEWLDTLNVYKKNMNKKRRPNPNFVDPALFIQELSERMDTDGIYVADVGQNQIFSCNYHKVKEGLFLTSGGMGTMGYSIPAAMGAKLANKNRQVIAVCGDGSFQMSMMELATLNQYEIPLKIIVMKNTVLGMVREYQHFTYQNRYIGVNIINVPDLEKISQAYDMEYLDLENMEQYTVILEKFLKSNSRIILELNVDPDDIVR